MKQSVVMAADPCGFDLKNAIKAVLEKEGYPVLDLCPDAPMEYSAAACAVAGTIQRGGADRGIAICGTGMGVSIVCNKHRGVYAALCENLWQAVRSRTVNNANVLCLGGMITGEYLGAQIALAWMQAEHMVGLDPEMQALVQGEADRIVRLEEKLYANDGRPQE